MHNETPAPGFSDSWNGFRADDWVTYAQWKDLTARSGHWRSGQLKAVDGALETYEGAKNPKNLSSLKTAFQKWYTNNKAEVANRNKANCIDRLAFNLRLAKELLKQVRPCVEHSDIDIRRQVKFRRGRVFCWLPVGVHKSFSGADLREVNHQP